MAPVHSRIEMGSFGSPPIFSTTGMMGGYPAPPLRTYIGRGSNIQALIDAKAELPNGEGLDGARPAFVDAIDADWELVLGQNYPVRELDPGSLFSVVTGDGGGFGDPLERLPVHVARDVVNRLTSRDTAARVFGVVIGEDDVVDEAATAERRAGIRRQRLERGIPAAEYRAAARERVLAKDFPQPVRAMYADVIRISRKFANEFRAFWALPDDYEV
jgi:acetone carboxylase alpha subunit